MAHKSSYLTLYKNQQLHARAKTLAKILASCTLCPRQCKVNRLEGEKGWCRAGALAKVSSVGPHFGEERPLVGHGGSGAIFFSHCTLRCVFCQNFEISCLEQGNEVSHQELADYMLHLQNIGCHNINFVTPTHFIPQIIEALVIAIEKGLTVPLLYNTGGYDLASVIKLLDGIIDIYMPDIKYMTEAPAEKYSHARDYPDRVKEAVKEMHRQVGELQLDDQGIALRGLLVRHLVLPEGLEDAKKVMEFLADEISKDTYINIMDQYYPCYKAREYPPLDRRIYSTEYQKAVKVAQEAGLWRFD